MTEAEGLGVTEGLQEEFKVWEREWESGTGKIGRWRRGRAGAPNKGFARRPQEFLL